MTSRPEPRFGNGDVSRGFNAVLWIVGIATVVSAAVALDFLLGSLGCGGVPFVVRGSVVDARTGAPVEGVSLLTLFEPAMADDAEEVARRRDFVRNFGDASEEDGRLFFATVGSARTGPDGSFSIVAELATSVQKGASGFVWSRHRSSPVEIAGALLVEREGYARLVHDTRDARWIERREGEIVGTLEVGTIRLAPR